MSVSERPAPADLIRLCEDARRRHPGECRFLPDYEPRPWEARVRPHG